MGWIKIVNIVLEEIQQNSRGITQYYIIGKVQEILKKFVQVYLSDLPAHLFIDLTKAGLLVITNITINLLLR